MNELQAAQLLYAMKRIAFLICFYGSVLAGILIFIARERK